ncbi:heparinase II/III family protein [Vibrio cyclitrophicus]
MIREIYRNINYLRMLVKHINKVRVIKNNSFCHVVFKGNKNLITFLGFKNSKEEADEIIENGIKILDLRVKSEFYDERFWNECPKYKNRYDKNKVYFQAKTFERTDIKYLWEIGRLQYLVIFAKAYRETGNKIYLDKVDKALEGFIENTSYYKGVQWQCPMDVALRLVSLTSLFFLLDLSVDDYDGILLKHLSYMLYNDEWSQHYTGNHHFICVCGILYALTSLTGLEDLKSFYYNRFKYEVGNQFNADGGNFESSISYHYFVSEAIHVIQSLYEDFIGKVSNELTFELNKPTKYIDQMESRKSDEEIRSILGKIDVFSAWHMRPDGTFCLIGDNDSGFFLNKNNIKQVSSSYGVICAYENNLSNDVSLYNKKHVKEISIDESINFQSSKYFPDFGSLVVRSENCHVTISLAKVGQCGKGGHDHLDLLHCEIWINGKTFGKDPGVSSYTYSLSNRNRYRSSFAHNTPVNLDLISDLSLPFRLNKPKFHVDFLSVSSDEIIIKVTVIGKYKFVRKIKAGLDKTISILDYYNDDFLFKPPFDSTVKACDIYGENV